MNKTKREMIYADYEKQMPIDEICDKYDVNKDEVAKAVWSVENNANKMPKMVEKEMKMCKLFEGGIDVEEIAKVVHTQTTKVRKILRANGFEVERKRCAKIYSDRDERAAKELTDYKNGMSVKEISAKYGITHKIVYDDLKRFGIEFKQDDPVKRAITQEALLMDRTQRGWQTALAKKHGITRQRVNTILKQNNIV